jgi:hypothetical protein
MFGSCWCKNPMTIQHGACGQACEWCQCMPHAVCTHVQNSSGGATVVGGRDGVFGSEAIQTCKNLQQTTWGLPPCKADVKRRRLPSR